MAEKRQAGRLVGAAEARYPTSLGQGLGVSKVLRQHSATDGKPMEADSHRFLQNVTASLRLPLPLYQQDQETRTLKVEPRLAQSKPPQAPRMANNLP